MSNGAGERLVSEQNYETKPRSCLFSTNAQRPGQHARTRRAARFDGGRRDKSKTPVSVSVVVAGWALLVKVSVFARSSGYLRLKVTGNEHLTSLFTALAEHGF